MRTRARLRIRTKDGGYYWQCNRCDDRGTLRESIQAAQYAYRVEHGRRDCGLYGRRPGQLTDHERREAT